MNEKTRFPLVDGTPEKRISLETAIDQAGAAYAKSDKTFAKFEEELREIADLHKINFDDHTSEFDGARLGRPLRENTPKELLEEATSWEMETTMRIARHVISETQQGIVKDDDMGQLNDVQLAHFYRNSNPGLEINTSKDISSLRRDTNHIIALLLQIAMQPNFKPGEAEAILEVLSDYEETQSVDEDVLAQIALKYGLIDEFEEENVKLGTELYDTLTHDIGLNELLREQFPDAYGRLTPGDRLQVISSFFLNVAEHKALRANYGLLSRIPNFDASAFNSAKQKMEKALAKCYSEGETEFTVPLPSIDREWLQAQLSRRAAHIEKTK